MKKTLAVFAALALCAGIASADGYRVYLENFKENGNTLKLIELIAKKNGGDLGKAVQILQDARDGKKPVAIPDVTKKDSAVEWTYTFSDNYGIYAGVLDEDGREIALPKRKKGNASDGKGKK